MTARPREFPGQADESDDDVRDSDRDSRRQDRDINVHSQTGLPDVANTAIKEAGKNVQNFWQLLIVLLLVGWMVIFALGVWVICKYVIPRHLDSIKAGYVEVAHEFSTTQKSREDAHLEQVKELAHTFESTINTTIDKKDEAHTRTIQLILEHDRARNERIEFNSRIGKSP